MGSSDYVEVLFCKAAQDEFTIHKLIPDPASPDEVIGFHAQQAVEKLLKAVLSSASVRYRRTHDLVELIDLLRDHGVDFPEELEEVGPSRFFAGKEASERTLYATYRPLCCRRQRREYAPRPQERGNV